MTTRETLHRLIDELAEEELEAAGRYLECLRDGGDSFLRALLEAPEDDEPETREEAEAVREAREQYRRGEFVTAEEAKRLLLP